MKFYYVVNTGEVWNETEVREAFEQFKHEMQYGSYEEYLDAQLTLGRQRIGGMIECETTLEAWSIARGLEDSYYEYRDGCRAIAKECEEEGYPSHGANYELRVENLRKRYSELFEED